MTLFIVECPGRCENFYSLLVQICSDLSQVCFLFYGYTFQSEHGIVYSVIALHVLLQAAQSVSCRQ